MVKALFDTNILIDYLCGIPPAATELRRYEYKAVSIVTMMEVLAGAEAENEAAIRAWLKGTFQVVPLDVAIADRAVEIRRCRKIKLPDAIVWASAQTNSLLLVSRNTRDFPEGEPDVRVPYRL